MNPHGPLSRSLSPLRKGRRCRRPERSWLLVPMRSTRPWRLPTDNQAGIGMRGELSVRLETASSLALTGTLSLFEGERGSDTEFQF